MPVEGQAEREGPDTNARIKRKEDVSLPGMHGSARGADHEEEETIHNLRSLWDSALRPRSCRNRRSQQIARPWGGRRLVDEARSDGTPLLPEMSRMWMPLLD